MVDAAAAYLEEEASDLPELLEVESEAGQGGAEGDSRARATAVLRRLQEAGWIDVETRTNYEQFITLADYAIQVLDTLDRIRTQRPAEYAGFVYATYAALTVEDVERQGALALDTAYDRTEQLVKELKLLHHNIKRYTERLVQQTRPQDILAMHFLEYKDQVLDRSYHQLKTADNVSKYRPRILQQIERWLLEPGWVQEVARDLVRKGRFRSQDEAEEDVRRRLNFIRAAYQGMDDLLDEIDRRNAQYARASLEQVRYLLSSSKDVEGQLVDLLAHVADRLARGAWRADETLPETWQGLASLYPVETLEPASLYTPRRARRMHRPEPLVAPAVEAAERAAARDQARRRLVAKLTYSRVNEYVLSRLGSRPAIRAAELGVEDVDEFVKLIYVAAYAGNRRVGYTVDFDGEVTETAGGRFRFRNVTIRRR